MCTVKPIPISSPMVQITVIMARIIGASTTFQRRKKNSISRKMSRKAMGADTAICWNIAAPKVSCATGSPAR